MSDCLLAWKKILLLLLIACAHGLASAQAIAAGKVEFVIGEVFAKRATETVKLARGNEIFEGDRLESHESGTAHFRMKDGAFVSLRPSSILEIQRYRVVSKGDSSNEVVIALKEGTFKSFTGDLGKSMPGAVKFQTPTATIGIRGTGNVTNVAADNTTVNYTITGQHSVSATDNSGKTITLLSNAGEAVQVRAGQFPQKITPPVSLMLLASNAPGKKAVVKSGPSATLNDAGAPSGSGDTAEGTATSSESPAAAAPGTAQDLAASIAAAAGMNTASIPIIVPPSLTDTGPVPSYKLVSYAGLQIASPADAAQARTLRQDNFNTLNIYLDTSGTVLTGVAGKTVSSPQSLSTTNYAQTMANPRSVQDWLSMNLSSDEFFSLGTMAVDGLVQTQGATSTTSPASNLHSAFFKPLGASELPAQGAFTFSPILSTNPTDTQGNVGIYTNANFSVSTSTAPGNYGALLASSNVSVFFPGAVSTQEATWNASYSNVAIQNGQFRADNCTQNCAGIPSNLGTPTLALSYNNTPVRNNNGSLIAGNFLAGGNRVLTGFVFNNTPSALPVSASNPLSASASGIIGFAK
jgi:hypothetical protein